MGHFYTNYTLMGVQQQAVAEVLKGREAMVTPVVNNSVVVFDSQSDMQDTKVMSGLAKMLSDRLRCPVLAVLNHDDDILWYELYCNGKLEDEYDSSPEYFDNPEPGKPQGGDAGKLCNLLGSSNVDQVEAILRSPSTDRKYLFAFQRHKDLVHALGISPFGVAMRYRYIERDRLPEGLSLSDIVRTDK